MASEDLGTIRPPVASLKHRFNIEQILYELSEKVENSVKKAVEMERRMQSEQNIYCILEVKVPKTDTTVLGNLPTRLFEIAPSYLSPYVERENSQNDFFTYRFGFISFPTMAEEVVSTLSLLFENENLNYLPTMKIKAGIRDVKSGLETVDFQKTYQKEKFLAPFQDPSEFLFYYENVAKSMFIEELYRETNVSVSRLSDELVWLVRSRYRKGKREYITIEKPEEIIELAKWGCFEFFLENHKTASVPKDQFDKGTFPNIVFDFDIKSSEMREKLPRVLQLFQEDFEQDGLKYVTKLTGQTGANIHLYMNGFKPIESDRYIPLKLFRRRMEMSGIAMRTSVERMKRDPFEIARDYVRIKTKYILRKNPELRELVVHDYETEKAFKPKVITVDAGSVKLRSYHRAFFSLTKNRTVCLPLTQTGERFSKDLFDEMTFLSRDLEGVIEIAPSIVPKIERNSWSLINDFVEEYCRRLYTKEFEETEKKMGRPIQISSP